MKEQNQKQLASEWNEILEKHPGYARMILAQQTILMEASELGYAVIDRGMCELLDSGFPVLFKDYWVSRCISRIRVKVNPGGIIECLSHTNRDPARCFGNDDPDGWFDDPFAGGKTLPPRPPDPHI